LQFPDDKIVWYYFIADWRYLMSNYERKIKGSGAVEIVPLPLAYQLFRVFHDSLFEFWVIEQISRVCPVEEILIFQNRSMQRNSGLQTFNF
jgi:hypothetical protein